jgi:phosphatidylinositol glycan class B
MFSIAILTEASLRVSLLLAATACILRPTNLLIWSGICLPLAFNLSGRASRLPFSAYTVLLREACFAGITVLAISAISDRLYFQQWTFPPYHWLNFNISQDLAVFYGRNDWHYYLSQGLPLLLTTYLPFALIGLWRSTSLQSGQQAFTLASTTLLTIGTLSCIAHKEVRFIYPLLPILHVIAAPVVGTFFSEARTAESSSKRSTTSTLRRKPLLLFILLLNMAIAGYTSLVHQRGVLDVMIWLRNDFELLRLGGQSHSNAQPFSINETFVGFLMPCHSTPWRSSLMYPWLKAWALTCEPPIHLAARTEERLAYRDEADRFYDDPWLFMNSEIGTREDRPWPRYIVGFGGIGGDLERHAVKTMKGVEFVERWRGKNSDWHDDWRRTGDVVVWEMQNVENAYPQYNF